MLSYLNRGATIIPADFKEAESKGASLESILFAAKELRRILASIADLPGSVPLRSLSTEKGGIYSERFAKHPALVRSLKSLGFEPKQGGQYVRMDSPDVAVLRDAVADLDREIAKRTPTTGVSRSLAKLLTSQGKEKASFVVDKSRVCLSRIQRNPAERRYWTVDLGRLFKDTAVLAEARILFSGFGFAVDKSHVANWGGSDTNGLVLALAHLNEAWKASLLASVR